MQTVMKAIFISYNQALTDRVNRILDELGVRGFTRWALTEGRGTFDGEPHYGTHAWPSMNASVLAIVEDEKVAPVLDALRQMDATTKMQGSRAFVWNIEQMS
jgi:nitrogen regulatory protein PII